MEEKIKLLKENMNTFEKWGNPKYKGFLEHCLKHYPDISDKQLKSIEINYYQLQKYLNKGTSDKNKTMNNKPFKYDFEANQVFEDIEFENDVYDDIIYEHCLELKSRQTNGLTEEEERDILFHKNFDFKYLVYKKINVKKEYFCSDEEDSLITKVINSYGFNYCNNIAGILCLIETKNGRYIAGAGDDYMSEDRIGEYFGKADDITKEDFEKNIEYLIKGYLLKKSWINGQIEEEELAPIKNELNTPEETSSNHIADSVKFLNKIVNKNDNQAVENKFEYDYKKNWKHNTGQLLDSWHDEDSWFNADDYDEHEMEKLENNVYKMYTDKNGNNKTKIDKKELSYGEYTVEPEEFNKIYIDYPAFETITKVFNTYLFYYYDNAITGFLSLVETDKHNRYIVGEICDMIQEEGNFYLGKADNIDKKDFDKNIDYLITEYLSVEMGCY